MIIVAHTGNPVTGKQSSNMGRVCFVSLSLLFVQVGLLLLWVFFFCLFFLLLLFVLLLLLLLFFCCFFWGGEIFWVFLFFCLFFDKSIIKKK